MKLHLLEKKTQSINKQTINISVQIIGPLSIFPKQGTQWFMQEPQRRLLSSMWKLLSRHPSPCQRVSWCKHGTDGEKTELKWKTTQISFTHLTLIERYVAPRPYLSVHEDVDNWVVDGGALGKVCRHSSGKRMEGISWISRSKTGKNRVRSPADTVGQDHDNNHPGHFSLRFLGRLWFLLLQGNLSCQNKTTT